MGSLTEADKAAIRGIQTKVASMVKGTETDWSAYTDTYYSADAIVLPAHSPEVQGRAAITHMLSTFPPISNFENSLLEIDGQGDHAWVRGSYSMDLTPPGEDTIRDIGKYVEIWEKESDGQWRVVRDIFNSDLAMPGD